MVILHNRLLPIKFLFIKLFYHVLYLEIVGLCSNEGLV